jgi:hypothetical protein
MVNQSKWAAQARRHAAARPPASPQPGIIYPATKAAEFLDWTECALKQAAYDRRAPHTRIGQTIGFTAQNIDDIIDAGQVPAEKPLRAGASNSLSSQRIPPRRRSAPVPIPGAPEPVPLRPRPEASRKPAAKTR